MPKFMDDKVKKEVQEHLGQMKHPAKLIYFTQKHASEACQQQKELLQQLVSMSGNLSLQIMDLVHHDQEARKYKINKVPATVVLGEKDYGICFFGITAGYEFTSLLEAIMMISSKTSGLEPEIEALAKDISVPVHLEVMVTLTCPYCPQMVHLAHQLAFVNDNIQSDMIEASEFPVLVQRYQVQGVPRTIINERPAFEGALPAQQALMEIYKEVEPEKHERIDAALRQARGDRHVKPAQPDQEYDVAIIGAGPAAMSAAIYAVRKSWQVLLIGKDSGGQITDTATVENYLGQNKVGGRELAELFRNHAESYPVEQELHSLVKSIKKEQNMFILQTDSGNTYKSRSVIYSAGKNYRRLGVPGEDRFIGQGIAFCATCDAPLFRDRQVAVVGGGNSAFTAARDLLNYASEIHLIYNKTTPKADKSLQDRVKNETNVSLHFGFEVIEFLGQNQLEGIRISSTAGQNRMDLAVQGVFLEIGLEPNTAPVKELLQLNQLGEIPVQRDQSTAVPGFFAAGDATDEKEKQIIIAAGDGARAALTADKYLARLAK